MNLNIRPMVRSDLEEVALLSKELGYPASVSELQARWVKIQGLPHHALFVYAEEKVLGFIHLEIVDDLVEPLKVEIKAIVVNANSRGKGIGQMLISTAKNWAITNQIHTIYLSCNILRASTHEFYKREGFDQVRTSHFFELKI